MQLGHLQVLYLESSNLGCAPELARPVAGCRAGTVAAIGRLDQALRPWLALLCSSRCPGDIILQAYDFMRVLRETERSVIGGFQSPMEQECLRLLLRGNGSIVICPARSIEMMRVPAEWQQPITEGRLLILSPFEAKERRMTAGLAERRNEFVAALSDEVFIAHATPGGKTEVFAKRLAAAGKPLLTLDSPADANLVALGARVVEEPRDVDNGDG